MRILHRAGYALIPSAIVVLTVCTGAKVQANLHATSLDSNVGLHGSRQSALSRNRNLVMNRGLLSRYLATTPSFMDPSSVGKSLIFLSDYPSGTVNIYRKNGKNKMVGQITGVSPSAVASDAAGNVYVTNSTGSGINDVLVYAPPYTGPPVLSLDDAGYILDDVAISEQGIVAVVNLCDAPSCAGAGNVVLYAPNSITPCATVADPTDFAYVEFAGFDKKGNLYVDGLPLSGPASIGEIKRGCEATGITLLTTSNGIVAPGGIHVDKRDRIAIFESLPPGSGPPVIYTYERAKAGSLGSPVSTTSLPGTHLGDSNDFAFLASGANLYVADYIDGVASDYAYPGGGAAKKSISVEPDAPFGVAITPALAP